MTIRDLEERMEQFCVNELVVQEGNLVTMKLGIGLESGDYPYVQGSGDDLEGALQKAFQEAQRLCGGIEATQ